MCINREQDQLQPRYFAEPQKVRDGRFIPTREDLQLLETVTLALILILTLTLTPTPTLTLTLTLPLPLLRRAGRSTWRGSRREARRLLRRATRRGRDYGPCRRGG